MVAGVGSSSRVDIAFTALILLHYLFITAAIATFA
jgi:hypothetical protein